MKSIRQNIGNTELEKIEHEPFSSFNVRRYERSYFTRNWHHHPEFELLLITKGYGQRFVGDSVEYFEPGDLVLIGEHIPHAWISDESFTNPENKEISESYYIQFNSRIFNTRFFELAELRNVRNLLNKANRGVKVTGKERHNISRLIKRLPKLNQLEKLLQLIRILDMIGRSEYQLLVSLEFLSNQLYFKSKRMTVINTFVMENFRQDLTVEKCAQKINMTPTSFCRFFKNHTNLTFTQYLNNLRLDFAQKLLLNTEMPIKEICYECGFNSVAYFNQRFKASLGKSPSHYRNRE